MSAFEKIIGYSEIKRELAQIADTLRNREAYEKLGVPAPRGLMLEGIPGVGKTLMAQCLIEESGRIAFTCRKIEPDGKFVETITRTFEKAAEAAPSIVFLDDLDKFANNDENHRNSEEFVAVQSCIDGLRGKEVFVLATANDMKNLPHSLTRVGRFDRIIEVEAPEGKDPERIIAHYLNGKKFVADTDASVIAEILSGKSCAALETVINEAGLIAGYQRSESITMDHVIEASMRTVFNARRYGSDEVVDIASVTAASQAVWHEAGHTVESEVLFPGSVVLASAREGSHSTGGFVRSRLNDEAGPLRCMKGRIILSLGGLAATEARFGRLDAGARLDLVDATRRARDLFVSMRFGGFALMRGSSQISEARTERIETATDALLETSYRTAKEILCQNREFLEKMAQALACKDAVLASDVRRIRNECNVIEVPI